MHTVTCAPANSPHDASDFQGRASRWVFPVSGYQAAGHTGDDQRADQAGDGSVVHRTVVGSTLGVALVYLGEHYVVDLAAGLALAEGVRAATPAVAPLRSKSPSSSRSCEIPPISSGFGCAPSRDEFCGASRSYRRTLDVGGNWCAA